MEDTNCKHGIPHGGHCSACNNTRQNYRYVCLRPLDGIVHLRADDRGARFRYISIERRRFVENGGFPARERADILVIPLSHLEETESITDDHVKHELAKLHGCSPEDITLSISRGVRGRRGGIPDSREYGRADGMNFGTIGTHHGQQKYRKSRRYSHGLDPDLPPPGWVAD